MRKGFTFDAALCVSCKACSAACILENGLQPGTRTLFAWNDHALPLVGVINFSMACNHCAEPACASGCPALAYTTGPDGVVIHHADRCMGCGYCTWRCPYDAPKINPVQGYIEKCHFCADRSTQNTEPACVTACPTGALKMTEREEFDNTLPAWFPDTGIKPSVFLKNAENPHRPLIIPADSESDEADMVTVPGAGADSSEQLKKEWSLALFSLLVITASVMLMVSALRGTAPAGFIPVILLAGAMAVSVLHLGVPGKSWRAVLNILSSPLSREIAMVLLLAFVAFAGWLKPDLIPPLITGLLALLTLISVDNVYFAADRSFSLKLHSGQAYFTGLYAVTWFIEPTILFIVFSMLAALSVVKRYKSSEAGSLTRSLYYIRGMALPVVFMLIYPDSLATDIAALVVFIAGMIADRLLFYCDFRPPNIKDTLAEHLVKEYEKERDKQRQDAGIS
ncbi:MAG TPA: 4Fe-4S binding protein [Bacteroidales bacterium]|nr:4Fe-4S binding protein [Bacteroidales bacterium]